MIYENLLPPEKVFCVAEHIMKSQPELKFVLEGVRALYATPYNPWNPIASYAFKSVEELKTQFPDIDVQKLATFAGEFLTPETAKPLMSEFDVYFHHNYTEVVPKGYSKGKATEIVENLLRIPHEATVSIGDSQNDIPMFRTCAISIAMGNSPDEVKKEADIITEHVANDGAAKAIARLCGISYERVLRDIQAGI